MPFCGVEVCGNGDAPPDSVAPILIVLLGGWA